MSATPPAARGDDTLGAPGPGRLLRGARESAGISLRDVSAQMHLDERTMHALENDAFGELPAPTFVRGYLRGYARLLGVPVGPVMEAYEREGFTPPDLVADIAEKPQANSSDFPVRMTTYVVVVVLAALVVVWWHNQGYDEPTPIEAPVAATADVMTDARAREPSAAPPLPPIVARTPEAPATDDASAPAQPSAAQAPSRAGDAPTPAPAAGARPGAGSTQGMVAGTGVEPRVEQMLSEAERVLERSRGEIDAAARTSLPATPPAAATTASPTASGAPAPAAATGSANAAVSAAPGSDVSARSATSSASARLRLRFPEEAWVEVYDRADQRVFYNLVRPGQELDLRAEPPLRVLLGRTRGVSVEYDGQPVDLEPHTERGVARFTLGP